MRRRALLPVLAALAGIVFAAGCQPRESSSPAVASDLHSYMQELQKWEPKEKTVFAAVEDVERSQYVDDDYVVRTLKSALPTLEEHLRLAGSYRPLTPEVLDIHDHYKKGYEDMKAGMEKVIASVASKNYVELATAKAQVKKAYTDILKAFRALDIMLEEHRPEIEKIEQSQATT